MIIGAALAKVIIPLLLILLFLPVLIWMERKGSAFIQDRHGPNRASIKGIRMGGMFHALADVFKLLFKEDITPNHVHKFYYYLAPAVAVTIACITFIVIPFAAPIPTETGFFTFQSADLNIGILYILAMSSLGVYGAMLAGWSSNNKFALLGGLRSSAQMVSYELCMGLTVLSVILTAGSLTLNDIVTVQTSSVWQWNAIRDPLACIIFIIAAFAETNRAPFDLPEGESELVAGYHVEYSSMKFAMFYMAEYIHMFIASALIVTLFFGGWQIPFVSTDTLRANAGQITYYAALALGLFSLLVGALLSIRFKKGKYGDKRDYEVLVFGVPAVAFGLIIFLAALFFGKTPLALETSLWVGAVIQILTFILKILSTYLFFLSGMKKRTSFLVKSQL